MDTKNIDPAVKRSDRNCRFCTHFLRIEDRFYCRNIPGHWNELHLAIFDMPCQEWTARNSEEKTGIHFVRTESDLDSIEVSSSPRRKIKIYFNTRSDSKAEVEKRIIDACNYAELAEKLLGGLKDV